MAYTSINFLDSDIPLPFRFTAMLPFSDEDRHNMRWLNSEIRYYGIENELRKGGRAIAFKGFVSNKKGERLRNLPSIVLKVPNLKPELYDSGQIIQHLSRQSDESGREWQLTRKRLHGCEYANPIFDFSVITQVDYLGELMPIPVTAQMFLHDAKSLDEYLFDTHQRPNKYESKQGVPHDNWNGMSDPAKWIEISRAIAMGLADIHERRVVHGDIWPPNIFIKVDSNAKPVPIFIDFGEAFPLEPKGDSQNQRDHAYRAPERNDAQSIVTQQSDVYSFGKLILHLATGKEPILSSKYRGHARREVIRDIFILRNPAIISDNPFIMDIICKCVTLDPVDRPDMSEILRAFDTYIDIQPRKFLSISDQIGSLQHTWNSVTLDISNRGTDVDPFLEEIVEQRLDEVRSLMSRLSNDVVKLKDTRERLISAMVGLFLKLGQGDRFLSITSPGMWQGSALGLDGRYFTAAEIAAIRGASIQRAFLFSIQEIGEIWATSLCDNLDQINDSSPNHKSINLARAIRIEINKYIGARQQGDVHYLPESLQIEARQRLSLVIKSYLNASTGICKDVFNQSNEFSNSVDCKGIYIGLIPVSSLSTMRTLKSAHPVSVFFYSSVAGHERYLLMMTDCLGRNPLLGSEEKTYDDVAFQKSKPELRGITVFRSVLGVPQDRIKKIEHVLRRSINIGGWIDSLYAALPPSKLSP